MVELSPEEARARLLNEDGAVVRLTVGLAPDDPVIDLRNEDGMIMGLVVRGWSEGIDEAVCEESSDFLRGYLRTRERLEAIEPEVSEEEETITLTLTRSEARALMIECACCNTGAEAYAAWSSLNTKNYEAMLAA